MVYRYDNFTSRPENNASRELKYRIELARNQVAIATISIGIGGIDNYGIVSPVSNTSYHDSKMVKGGM